jgi:hypothetical protein
LVEARVLHLTPLELRKVAAVDPAAALKVAQRIASLLAAGPKRRACVLRAVLQRELCGLVDRGGRVVA